MNFRLSRHRDVLPQDEARRSRLPWHRVESDVDFVSRVEFLRWLTKQTTMHSSYLPIDLTSLTANRRS
jgi:hypothetical protein